MAKPNAVNGNTPIPASPRVILRFDGSCSPNPGPMGIGYTLELEENSRILVRVGAQIGQGTNNAAEYNALLAGLRHALRLGLWNIAVRSDSLLVVNQMHGVWKVKDHTLRNLRDRAKNLWPLFNRFSLQHVYREDNRGADDLSRCLVFEEPTLPPLLVSRTSRKSKILYDWQAAAIRVWWERYHPGAGTLANIFGVSSTLVEQIGYGQTYKAADFSSYPAYLAGHILENK